MKHKKMYLACLFYSCFTLSHAQQSLSDIVLGPNGLGPSPDISALAGYVETPVSLYTGVPEINIPLYTISSGNLSLPISLSYLSQGIRVEQMATSVGLGWSLNAGGAVTRVVKGLPDDYNQSQWPSDPCGRNSQEGPWAAKGYFSLTNEKLQSLYSYDGEHLVSGDDGFNIILGVADAEPDVFYFNFAGYTGEFVFDVNKVPHIFSQSDLVITPSFDANQEISAFTIIATDGTKFYFNDAERSVAKSFNSNSMGGYNFTYSGSPYQDPYLPIIYNSGWYLSKIESATSNSKIEFSYDVSTQIYLSGVSEKINNYNPAASGSGFLTTHITGKVLRKISYKDGAVDFSYNHTRQDVGGIPGFVVSYFANPAPGGWLNGLSLSAGSLFALTDIIIRNDDQGTQAFQVVNQNTVKQYKLEYSYFQSTETISNDANFNSLFSCYLKRLKLNSIQEIPLSGSATKPPYTFGYDETNTLPFLFSYQQDHWGYYNKNGASTLIPKIFYHPNATLPQAPGNPGSRSSIYSWPSNNGEVITGVADRSPNPTYMSAGILKTITYPTGGSTTFDYEPNDFYYLGQNRTGGGLRIKKKTVDNIITQYSYKTGSTSNSSGRIFYMPQYARDFNPNNNSFPAFMFSNSLVQLGGTNGNVIGYGEVTTQQTGNGKTVSYFEINGEFQVEQAVPVPNTSNFLYNRTHRSPNSIDLDDYPFAPNPNIDFARGNLLEEKLYDNNGNLVKDNQYQYTLLGEDSPVLASRYCLSGVSWCNTGGQFPGMIQTQFSKNNYYYNSAWYRLTSVIETQYDPATAGSAYSINTNYTYGNSVHKLVTQQSSTDSKGKTSTSITKYPSDFSYVTSPSAPEAQALKLMSVTKHMHSQPVYQETWLTDASNTRILSGKIMTYADFQPGTGSVNSPQLLAAKTYVLETDVPIVSGYTSTDLSNSFIKDSRYKERSSLFYDANDNVVHNQVLNTINLGSGTPNHINSCLLWGYNNKYPIARVTNATERDAAATSFESSDVTPWLNFNYQSPVLNNDAHAGNYSADVPPGTFGPGYLMWPSADYQGTRFIFSCWVKTNTAFGNNKGHLILHTTNAIPGSTTPFPGQPVGYTDLAFSNTGNQWKYLEVAIEKLDDVKQYANVTGDLQLWAYIQNTDGSNKVQVDDMRLMPMQAKMETYTYLPQVGKTSSSDANNEAVLYEYDEYNRFKLTRDLDKNITKQVQYNYK